MIIWGRPGAFGQALQTFRGACPTPTSEGKQRMSKHTRARTTKGGHGKSVGSPLNGPWHRQLVLEGTLLNTEVSPKDCPEIDMKTTTNTIISLSSQHRRWSDLNRFDTVRHEVMLKRIQCFSALRRLWLKSFFSYHRPPWCESVSWPAPSENTQTSLEIVMTFSWFLTHIDCKINANT